eukprot:9511010-Lingulodinium_polyedra.AAC.1
MDGVGALDPRQQRLEAAVSGIRVPQQLATPHELRIHRACCRLGRRGRHRHNGEAARAARRRGRGLGGEAHAGVRDVLL